LASSEVLDIVLSLLQWIPRNSLALGGNAIRC